MAPLVVPEDVAPELVAGRQTAAKPHSNVALGLWGVPEGVAPASPLGLIGLACTARPAQMSAAEGRTIYEMPGGLPPGKGIAVPTGFEPALPA